MSGPLNDEDKKKIQNASSAVEKFCERSNSRWYRYGSTGYKDSVRHFFESSSENAFGAVQPANAGDLSEIIKILAQNKARFAVKGGGHATNPGFSSTYGIQISMTSFNKCRYNSEEKTLTVGAGCLFDEVYRVIFEQERNIVGGSASQGVGVAGWLLGGGYSLASNRYGLGIDNILEFEVVLPDGRIVRAKDGGEFDDLFFALKGGGNNFGIVTEFVLKTHPQSNTWGGTLVYNPDDVEEVKKAIAAFIEREETQKAVIVAAFRHILEQGDSKYQVSVMCVHDDPKPKDDPFGEFLYIPRSGQLGPDAAGWGRDGGINSEVTDTSKDDFGVKNFLQMDTLFATNYGIPISGGGVTANDSTAVGISATGRGPSPKPAPGMSGVGELPRGRFGCIMISKYTKALVDAVEEQSRRSAKKMKQGNAKRIIFDVWPAHSKIFDNSTPAAWPHKKGQPFGPMLAYFLWEGAENDKLWVEEMGSALKSLYNIALAQGCTSKDIPIYQNTTLADIPVRAIYRENLETLGRIRFKYDPEDIMRNAGAENFKIPLRRDTNADDSSAEDDEELFGHFNATNSEGA